MKKTYYAPHSECVRLSPEDVITTSGAMDDEVELTPQGLDLNDGKLGL